MTEKTQTGGLTALTASVTRYVRLLIEDTRLSAAEKMTKLIASAALAAILAVFAISALLFAALALGCILAPLVGVAWAFVIVAVVLLLIALLMLLLRKTLIFDPIARYISRVMLTPPQPNYPSNTENNNDDPTPIP